MSIPWYWSGHSSGVISQGDCCPLSCPAEHRVGAGEGGKDAARPCGPSAYKRRPCSVGGWEGVAETSCGLEEVFNSQVK